MEFSFLTPKYYKLENYSPVCLNRYLRVDALF